MRHLGKITADLAQFRRRFEELTAAAHNPVRSPPAATRLSPVTEFGSNPGNLRMFVYVPDRLPKAPALVVVLHGCTQTAAGYDEGAGWSRLADRYGFALLLPEQQQANNAKTCFNWFEPGDIARGRGEALSIRQMVERMVADHGIDRRRIFVTGLSAGGAMASVMLATYPEVFAAGAIIAGLPYGGATTVQEALASMFQGRSLPAREWGERVRAASPHKGPWPRVSVWHGSADATVKPTNADEIVKQWADVHGLAPTPSAEDRVNGYPRRVWRGPEGEEVIEAFTITRMAHGTPVGAGPGEEAWGSAGAFLLDVGISSSFHIAKFWGLTDRAVARDGVARVREEAGAALAGGVALVSPNGEIRFPPRQPEPAAEPANDAFPPREPRRAEAGAKARPIDVQAVIAKALKAAGLLRR